jgi:hypothetical protein
MEKSVGGVSHRMNKMPMSKLDGPLLLNDTKSSRIEFCASSPRRYSVGHSKSAKLERYMYIEANFLSTANARSAAPIKTVKKS